MLLKTLHVPAICKVCGRQIHKLEKAWQECKTITMHGGQPVNEYRHTCDGCYDKRAVG